MIERQLATEIAEQQMDIGDILRGDPYRTAFLRLAWTGNIGCATDTDVLLTSALSLDSSAGPAMQGNVWDISGLSSGLWGIKANGLLWIDVALRPAVNYTGISGRMGVTIVNPSATIVAQVGPAHFIGNISTGETATVSRIAGRQAAQYRFRFRWSMLVTPSIFSLGGVFATIIWFPIRY